MTKGGCIACDVVSLTAMTVVNAAAWAEGLDWGSAVTGATVLTGLVIGLVAKVYSTRAAGIREVEKARAEGIRDADKARAEGYVEVEKAKAEAEAYKRRLEMKVQAEWEDLNAHSLKGQIEQLTRTVGEMRAVGEATKQRADDANEKLHEQAKLANVQILRRDEQIGDLHRTIQALTDEVKALRENEARLLSRLTLSQVRQDVQIKDNRAAIVETARVAETAAAAVERIAGSSSTEIPVVKLDEGGAAG
jgi:chromosome segregation ATPase